jgi:hypothetical protein
MLRFITWDEVDQVSSTRTRVTKRGNLIVVWGVITVAKFRGARPSGQGSKSDGERINCIGLGGREIPERKKPWPGNEPSSNQDSCRHNGVSKVDEAW